MEDINGHLVLLMAPSGSGKKAVMDGLGDLKEQLYFAKTYTSREPRQGTEENPRYEFVSRDEFEAMIKDDELIEWAEFSGNYYGTPKQEVLAALLKPQVVFKEMELQGVQQMKQFVPAEKLTTIYIDAGGWEALRERVVARAPITDDALALRKERYDEEVQFKPEADVVITNRNGELETARATFRNVIAEVVESVS